MICSLIYKVLDINLLAQWHLSHRSRKQGMFVYRVRIQLSISQDAIVKSPNQICYIGTALLGAGTPKNETTVVNKSCPPRSLLAGVPARVVREGVRWTDKSRIEQSLVQAKCIEPNAQ